MVAEIDRLLPLREVGSGGALSPPKSPKATQGGQPFQDLYEHELAKAVPVSFTNHAQSRLTHRQIALSREQIARLEHGVEQAAQKGARDSLVLVDNLAFIVNVARRTVVTAVEGAAKPGSVFTQIDSAVVA